MTSPNIRIEHGGFGMPPALAALFRNPVRVTVGRGRGRTMVTYDPATKNLAGLIDDGLCVFGRNGATAMTFTAETDSPERLAVALEDVAQAIRTAIKETK